MLISFDNETENGKLYISYPMVEALRDFEEGQCGKKDNCFIAIEKGDDYKAISAARSHYQQFEKYDDMERDNQCICNAYLLSYKLQRDDFL